MEKSKGKPRAVSANCIKMDGSQDVSHDHRNVERYAQGVKPKPQNRQYYQKHTPTTSGFSFRDMQSRTSVPVNKRLEHVAHNNLPLSRDKGMFPRANQNRKVFQVNRGISKNVVSKLKDADKNKKSIHYLRGLITKEPSEILLNILDKTSKFRFVLKEEVIDHEVMVYVLLSLGKAVTSSMHCNVNAMLHLMLHYKNFLSLHVPKYLASFHCIQMTEEYSKSLESITEFLVKFQLSMPSTASEIILVLVPLLENTCKTFLSENVLLRTSLLKKIQEMDEEKENFLKQYTQNESRRATAKEKVQLQSPPENFHSISILPTLDDIHLPCSFLRPNLVTGQYVDTEHYLDVQYRLLREDYIKPLRDGISEYLSLKNSGQSLKNLRDVKVYTDVQIVDKDYAKGGFVHIAFFNDEKFAHIKWESSKRFLSGSLLCLSDDDFRTVYFASVADRDAKKLMQGYLLLTFEELTDEVLSLNSSRRFVVVESSAYFVAYRHNLKALSRLDENTLPMKPYILEVKKNVDKPMYLKNDACYDIQPLLMSLDSNYIENFINRGISISILKDEFWPTHSDLNLDFSQHAAIKAALTKEFVVIQGPPGTGKTYVGLRIVQLLLHNIDEWQAGEKPSPILVVCYTNHALDQFLEGLLLFTKNVVRVGGRSTNEAIQNYQLNNIKKKFSENRLFPSHIVKNIQQKYSHLNTRKAIVDEVKLSIAYCHSSILGECILRNHIEMSHFQSLKSIRMLKDDGNLIYDWLNIRIRTGNEVGVVLPNIPEKFSTNLMEDHSALSDNIAIVKTKSEKNTDSEGEADIEHIEAERKVDSEEFADVNFNVSLYKRQLELAPASDDGWKVQGGNKKRKKYVKHCSESSKAMSKDEARKIRNVWELPLLQRWRLYKLWLDGYIEEKRKHVLELQIQMRNEHQELCELRKQQDLFVCQKSLVVGMTTTGAAKNQDLVQQMNPKIVIVEEAAEILESHIVTSLAHGTEHLILIGDHQQLRPNPTVHMLAVKYDLNISLFERMLKNGMQCYRLGIQHRMRPEISALLVPHIYKKLQNHESVFEYENIKGIGKNVFFITHSSKELQEYESKSKVNQHEAKFMVQLCRYILLQGYEPSQITILTTYSGQLFALRKEMYKEQVCEGVKVTVVDNYQGEENDIILISFVRSNDEGNIGFLKISNRVCVALSRAKKGLYCMGNFQLLAEKSDLWENIVSTLKKSKAIGPCLQLMCQNHPDVCNAVANEKDFSSVPEGGCTRDCEFRLSCGHVCSLKCHPYDKEHEEVKCHKPCNRKCVNEHLCPKECHQECGDCYSLIDKKVEPCGHVTRIFCYRKDKPAVCPVLCKDYLSCGYHEGSVKGVLRNVHFISSELTEPKVTTFLLKFWKYLLMQGYSASQITILTTDIHHLEAIQERAKPKAFYSGLKCISTNEDYIVANDLMLVSFVHRKALGEISFLEASNRACVAFSEAKRGIFCIGKFDQFAKKYDFWENITNSLEPNEAIGPSLHLQCQNHPEINIIIENETAFDSVPGGGCTKNCEFLLSCGHVCSLKCHTYDVEHKAVKCSKPCVKKCNYGHLCRQKCYEECGYCDFIVDKKRELCSHVEKVACGFRNEPFKTIACSQLCEIYLPCGHMCTNMCGTLCETKCVQNIKIKSPICSHEVIIECSKWDNIELLQEICKAPCGIMLSCGHLCTGTCGGCHQGRLHVACKQPCQHVLVCGHKCYALCCESCPPCMHPCENRCVHSICLKTCGEPCDKCTKPCEWFCTHKKCTSLCSESCNHASCDEPCSKSLKCGHKCIGLCGEPCPEDCKICDQDKAKYEYFGSEDMSNARYVRLEDCLHIFDVKPFTKWILQDHQGYKVIQMKGCPKCKVIIRVNHRFGNIIKSCLENIELVKKVTCDENCDKTKDGLVYVVKDSDFEIKRGLFKAIVNCENRQALTILENILYILKRRKMVNINIGKLLLVENCYDSDTSNINSKVKSYTEMTKKWLSKFVISECLTASEQQLQELVWEVHRLTLAQEILEDLNSKNKFDVRLKDLIESLIIYTPFREKDAEKFYGECKKVNPLMCLTDIKNLPILKTSGLAKNNWFQCVNSHVYSAMQSVGKKEGIKCYECKEKMDSNDISYCASSDYSSFCDTDSSDSEYYDMTLNLSDFN